MNKMPILEATLPARDECLFPTQADARHHFARLHLFGKISCGIPTPTTTNANWFG